MLATQDPRLEAQGRNERADVVVGVHGGAGVDASLELAERVREGLTALAQPRQTAVVIVDGRAWRRLDADGARDARPVERARGPLTALLGAAEALDASACALVTADAREGGTDFVERLLAPVLRDGYDLVWPVYVRHKFEGGLHAGIAYPFARAVFGRRLRQPVVTELAFSRAVARQIADESELHVEPSHGGHEALLIAHGIGRGLKVCQAVLGPAPTLPERADVSDTLARVVGLLFEAARRQAASWQRVRGSEPVSIVGALPAFAAEPRPLEVTGLVEAFTQGTRALQPLWARVLPPATLLALKRASARGGEAFRLETALWARVVYDFAVAYAQGTMDRGQLLRSMTPLYLGWMAGWVNTVRDFDGAAAEDCVEGLCAAFEAEKPYFISRWRWPDRFAP